MICTDRGLLPSINRRIEPRGAAQPCGSLFCQLAALSANADGGKKKRNKNKSAVDQPTANAADNCEACWAFFPRCDARPALRCPALTLAWRANAFAGFAAVAEYGEIAERTSGHFCAGKC
jgi:hypothetical protein